ncbi:MAG: tetratricopeptide repeat protein [Planctomycetes bacterium]|nr:tetratricopeptide repeat protein [Planctomycetota bacterium]
MPNEVDQGVAHHQAGKIQQAVACYQKALEINPKNADAIHLLGVVAHQNGNHAQGAEEIRKALAISPAEATFHANLADALRANGDYIPAESHARKAVDLNPKLGEAHNILGILLMNQKGDFENAEKHIRQAIAINPQNGSAHNNLATLLRQTQGIDAALAAFKASVDATPNHPPALCNYGQALLENDQIEEALNYCQIAAALGPELPECHNNLANVFRARGSDNVALALYQRALNINPNLAMTHSNIAQTFHGMGKSNDAQGAYQKAIELEPNEPRYRGLLGSLFLDDSKNDEALAAFQGAVNCGQNISDPLVGLASALMELQRYEEAFPHLEKAAQLPGDRVNTLLTTARWHYEKGNIEQCVAISREVLNIKPRLPAALHYIVSTLRADIHDEEFNALQDQANDPQLNDGAQCSVNFTLAMVLDAKKEHAAAAHAMRKGNALQIIVRERKDETYNHQRHAEFIDRQIQHFTAKTVAEKSVWGNPTVTPIFIMGIPRSGTTLTEQVICGNSSIYGAGELPNIAKLMDSIPGRVQSEMSSAACFTNLNKTQIRAYADEVLGKMESLSDGSAHITDKMPDNYLHVGLILSLFPNAKIIHCQRNVRDTILSCYITQFKAIRWANDIKDIEDRVAGYFKIMDHWRSEFPGRIHEIKYEESVEDLESVAKGISSYIGLDWDPACLDFQNNKRAVKTASVVQERVAFKCGGLGPGAR